MPLLGHIVGGAVFGLAARFWQLGIQRRPILENPAGHAACVAFFSATGYWWWQATVHMQGVLEEKENELRERRKLIQMRNEAILAQSMKAPEESPAAKA